MTKKKPKFEEMMLELETVVTRLESNDLPLDQAILLYQSSQQLLRQCEHQLQDAEIQVQTLLEHENGFRLEPFQIAADRTDKD